MATLSLDLDLTLRQRFQDQIHNRQYSYAQIRSVPASSIFCRRHTLHAMFSNVRFHKSPDVAPVDFGRNMSGIVGKYGDLEAISRRVFCNRGEQVVGKEF